MSAAPRPRPLPAEWRPGASCEALRARAGFLAEIRAFFAERGVLEVETPLLATTTATDPHLASLQTTLGAGPGGGGRTMYLQTSPESAMKRLLAAGAGAIYQIGKAFRDGEQGRLHNPEFTLLEWYRPGFDQFALMDEVEALVTRLLGTSVAAPRSSYRAAVLRHAGIDPLGAPARDVRAAAVACGLDADQARALDRDACLDLIMSARVQPWLGAGAVFVHGFPASQAAMARLAPGDPAVAERFELYVDGIEIANGYAELTDAAEQRRRIEADRARRAASGRPVPPRDERLLAALASGMPACAGVALGVDRLLMVRLGASSLDEVLAFSVERA